MSHSPARRRLLVGLIRLVLGFGPLILYERQQVGLSANLLSTDAEKGDLPETRHPVELRLLDLEAKFIFEVGDCGSKG